MNSSVTGRALEALRKHREELGDRQEPLVMPAATQDLQTERQSLSINSRRDNE
jgi:hypothetical protein